MPSIRSSTTAAPPPGDQRSSSGAQRGPAVRSTRARAQSAAGGGLIGALTSICLGKMVGERAGAAAADLVSRASGVLHVPVPVAIERALRTGGAVTGATGGALWMWPCAAIGAAAGAWKPEAVDSLLAVPAESKPAPKSSPRSETSHAPAAPRGGSEPDAPRANAAVTATSVASAKAARSRTTLEFPAGSWDAKLSEPLIAGREFEVHYDPHRLDAPLMAQTHDHPSWSVAGFYRVNGKGDWIEFPVSRPDGSDPASLPAIIRPDAPGYVELWFEARAARSGDAAVSKSDRSPRAGEASCEENAQAKAHDSIFMRNYRFEVRAAER